MDQSIRANAEFKVAGYFKIEVLKGDEVIREIPWQRNLVLDQGLDYLGNSKDWARYCHVGTDNTTPVVGDIQLGAFLAGRIIDSTATFSVNSTDHYIYIRPTYTFAIGATTGNISELGFGNHATTAGLFSRALIKDAGGNPTTLTILSDEKLKVYYEFRIYQPQADIFTGTIDGYACTLRSLNVNDSSTSGTGWYLKMQSSNGGGGTADGRNFFSSTFGNSSAAYTGAVSAITAANPLGSLISGYGSINSSGYTSGNYYVDRPFLFGTTVANSGSGIGAINLYLGPAVLQLGFVPNVMKTSLQEFSGVVRISWARKVLP